MLIDGYLTFKETVALRTVSYTVVLDHEIWCTIYLVVLFRTDSGDPTHLLPVYCLDFAVV